MTHCINPECSRLAEPGLDVCAPCYFRHAPPKPRVARHHRTAQRVRIDPDERFLSRLSIPSDPSACHEWTGARDPSGYGIARIGDTLVRAHRYAWTRVNGPVPAGMVVCHHCDNPPCCNEAHLWLATQGENIRDSMAKGRWHHGRAVTASPGVTVPCR